MPENVLVFVALIYVKLSFLNSPLICDAVFFPIINTVIIIRCEQKAAFFMCDEKELINLFTLK